MWTLYKRKKASFGNLECILNHRSARTRLEAFDSPSLPSTKSAYRTHHVGRYCHRSWLQRHPGRYSAKLARLSVAVIKACDCVGGKIWSVPLASGRGYAELGGAWINDKLQPRVWKLYPAIRVGCCDAASGRNCGYASERE